MIFFFFFLIISECEYHLLGFINYQVQLVYLHDLDYYEKHCVFLVAFGANKIPFLTLGMHEQCYLSRSNLGEYVADFTTVHIHC